MTAFSKQSHGFSVVAGAGFAVAEAMLSLDPVETNKGRGVTILLQTDGQGRPTPIHSQTYTKITKSLTFPLFDSVTTTNGTD